MLYTESTAVSVNERMTATQERKAQEIRSQGDSPPPSSPRPSRSANDSRTSPTLSQARSRHSAEKKPTPFSPSTGKGCEDLCDLPATARSDREDPRQPHNLRSQRQDLYAAGCIDLWLRQPSTAPWRRQARADIAAPFSEEEQQAQLLKRIDSLLNASMNRERTGGPADAQPPLDHCPRGPAGVKPQPTQPDPATRVDRRRSSRSSTP